MQSLPVMQRCRKLWIKWVTKLLIKAKSKWRNKNVITLPTALRKTRELTVKIKTRSFKTERRIYKCVSSLTNRWPKEKDNRMLKTRLIKGTWDNKWLWLKSMLPRLKLKRISVKMTYKSIKISWSSRCNKDLESPSRALKPCIISKSTALVAKWTAMKLAWTVVFWKRLQRRKEWIVSVAHKWKISMGMKTMFMRKKNLQELSDLNCDFSIN